MTDNVYRRIAAATASGDVEGLAALAMELASEVAGLESIRDADLARKAAQASRKKRLRLGMSRDIAGQDGKGGDGSPPPMVSSSFPTPHITPSFPPTPSPHLPAPKVIRVVPTPSPDVELVLAHYRKIHSKRRPGAKDGKAVAKALGWGFTAPELCEAIDGNAEDEWHREKHKHDLPYVLKDSGSIDNFREKGKPLALTDLWDYERGELTPLGERMTRPAAVA